MSKDTITVELPIEAGENYVGLPGIVTLSRDNWRDAVESPHRWSPDVRNLAPAVVAWIERDEWKPLDLPDEGRTIKATLRDGRVETFKVRKVVSGSAWTRVWKDDSDDVARYIQRVRDVYPPDPTDIVAWEYVDEPKFKNGDWVRVGADPDVVHAAWGQVGRIEDEAELGFNYEVGFPSGWHQIVEEKYLTPANPKDVEWKAGDTVPAGTSIGREWVGESVLTGHRSLFGVSDSRTATTDRKIVWLGESNA